MKRGMRVGTDTKMIETGIVSTEVTEIETERENPRKTSADERTMITETGKGREDDIAFFLQNHLTY